jgi:phage terminase large subunit-like protein
MSEAALLEPPRPPALTRAGRVIAFAEKYCRVPDGALVGQPLRLAPFQRKFITDVYDNPNRHTRRAYLSMARKNGKTALIAVLLLAHIVGPEAIVNASIISGAMSRDQAALVFELARKMIFLEPKLARLCRIVPSQKRIIGLGKRTEYHALSADAQTAHGQSPVLAILDEVGQVRGPTSAFIDAITTSQGAHAAPLLIAISTSAPSDADMFSMWIDDAIRSGDRATVVHEYKADDDAELTDHEQWKKANPGLGLFRSEEDLAQQIERAQRLPALEATARNLLLNQRIALQHLFIAPSVWKECSAPAELAAFRGAARVAIGLDLSARADLTAAVLAARDDAGAVHLLPFVFTPMVGLEERARRDRAPYPAFVDAGQLIAIEAASIEYEQVCQYLVAKLEELGIEPQIVAFDRWRIKAFRRAAADRGFAQAAEWKEVGQGFRDMSPRLEAFEGLLLDKRLRHGGHPLLNMAAGNAVAVSDPAGNRKLDKELATLRIDPLVAAVMAAYEVSDGAAGAFDVGAWIA